MTTPGQGPDPAQGNGPDQQATPRPRPRPAGDDAGGGGAGANEPGADVPGPPGFFPVPEPDLPDQHLDDAGSDVEGDVEGDVEAVGAGPWQREVLALRRRQHELDQALRRISQAVQIQQHHSNDTTNTPDRSEATLPLLGELDQRLALVEDSVRSLSVLVGEQQRAANPPMDWTRMRAVEAREAWPVLAQWVGEILVPCYELTRAELPDCWPLHQQAVYELSWLRSTHVQAYLPHAHPDLTAQWYTRWRPAALARIRELIPDSRCRPGEHLTTMEQSRARRADTGRPGQAPAATSADPAAVPPRAQPAVVAHWWGNYCMAAHADVAAREARDNAGAIDWAPPGLLNPVPDAHHPVPDPYVAGP